jgi:hypothetical protein
MALARPTYGWDQPRQEPRWGPRFSKWDFLPGGVVMGTPAECRRIEMEAQRQADEANAADRAAAGAQHFMTTDDMMRVKYQCASCRQSVQVLVRMSDGSDVCFACSGGPELVRVVDEAEDAS